MNAENNKVNRFIDSLKTKYGSQVEDLRSNLEEFCDNSQDVLDRVIEVVKDENVQQGLSAVAIIGPVFKLGLSIYDVVSKHSKSHDSYFLYNHALNAYDTTLKHLQITKKSDQISEKENVNLLRVLFKKIDDNEISETSILSHPLIKYLESITLEFFKKYSLEERWPNFLTYFRIQLFENLKDDPIFKKQKNKWKINKLYANKLQYFNKLLIELVTEQNPIDNKILSNYYIEGRLIELEIGKKDLETGKRNENLTDKECEKIYADENNRFSIDEFLRSEVENKTKFIVAPFGNGKTSFAKQQLLKKQITKYMLGESPWLPVYIRLEKGIKKVHGNLDLKQLLTIKLKPNNEKILLICDGLDEYSGDVQRLLQDIDDTLGGFIIEDNDGDRVTIDDWKKIVTTRPEAGLPFLEDKETFARLLPFDKKQVDEFFKRYFETVRPPLNWSAISRLNVTDDETGDYLLKKPLFCWMLAISYTKGYKDSYDNRSTSKALLYSNFFHSLLKGKPDEEDKKIIYEKWILRKIALLKAIYKDRLTTKDLDKYLKIFAESENNHTLLEEIDNISSNETKSILFFVLNSYFKIDEQDKRVDFLHKSFQEYFLAEHYIESILNDKWYRLGIELPSSVTIEFLQSILKIIVSDNKYEEFKYKLYKSIYLNTDNSLYPKDNKKLLVDKSKSIIEKGRYLYLYNFDNDKSNLSQPQEIEKWFSFPTDLSKFHLLLSYLLVPLFIIKKIDPAQNPFNLKDVIENIDFRKIENIYKFYPLANLSGADLRGADLRGADLTDADLTGANLSGANLSRAYLTGANLSGADLTGANLSGAYITGANLSGAYLSGTNLTDAYLIDDNLTGANLSGADLTGAYLSRANLSRAYLSRAYLTDANLRGANLSRAYLSHSYLSHANLTGANLNGADLTHAYLTGAYLSLADLINVDLSDVDLSGANLSGANLSGANLSGANLSGANLSGAILLKIEQLKLSRIIINQYTNFAGSIIDGKELMEILPQDHPSENIILIHNKTKLEEVLTNRGYSEEQIRLRVEQSRCI